MTWLSDLRLAARALRTSPRFTLLAALLLTLGIGAGTTVFSIADAVLFRPFPFADQRRLVIAGEDLVAPRSEISYNDFRGWRALAHTFEDMAAIGSTNWTLYLRTATNVVPVHYRAVSGGFFDLLGARPLMGRTFDARDDQRGSARTIVLGYGFWQRQLGGDPAIVGRTLMLSGTAFTVIGVMPAAFRYPVGADVWTPVVPDLAAVSASIPGRFRSVFDVGVLFVLGRVKPGIAIETARRDLDGAIADLSRRTGRRGHAGARVEPLVNEILGPARAGVWAWLAAVAVLLLVASANVAGLMLVRASGRTREFAIRLALGAPPPSLVRQLLCETLLLSALAAVAAVAVAYLALPVLVSLLPADVPRLSDARVDTATLGIALAIALVMALLGTLAPGLKISRSNPEPIVRRSGTAVASAGLRLPARRALIIGELAAAVVLLTSAGLLVRSVGRLGLLDLGFDPGKLLAVRLTVPGLAAENAEVRPLLDQVARELERVPGVESVAGVSLRPLQGPIGLDSPFRLEGQTPEEAAGGPYVNVETIAPPYFRAMRTRLLAGRAFTEDDRATTAPVLIVSQGFARLAWPGQSAIGKRLQVAAMDRQQPPQPTFRTVVGVVGDMRYRSLETPTPTVYAPAAQSPDLAGEFVVRAGVATAHVAPAIRERLRALRTDAAVTIDGMDDVVSALETPWRSNRSLFLILAGLTVLLAAVGLYALLAYTVVEQSREIGVRLVLGATPRRVAAGVLADGAHVVALGLVVGVVAAATLTRFMGALLFEVSPLDPLAFGAAPALLAVVAVFATLVPASRASRTDPAVCLRAE